MTAIPEKVEATYQILKRHEKLAKYVDAGLSIPQPFMGAGPIKLIVLGQDPTVQNAASRSTIKTVLNLDKHGSIRKYVSDVSQKLGFDLQQNVYATNLFKNFFVQPPAQITDINVFKDFLPIWLPILKEELAQYPDVPVITLGQPVLQNVLKSDVPDRLRKYWGYAANWKDGIFESFLYVKSVHNILGRTIFPFPHQPSLRKRFYKEKMDRYIVFMKSAVLQDKFV